MEEQESLSTSEDASPPGTEEPTLTFEAVIGIADARNLKDSLSTLLMGGECVRLDGGAVERADGAALQLLYVFFQAAEVKGITVEWAAASDSLRESARLTGLAGQLQLAA